MDIKKLKYKIVIDSREKSINHIINKFQEGFELKPSHHDMYRGIKSKYSNPVQYYIKDKGLKVGDYTIAVQLPNGEVINFQDKVVVERKADLNELASNFYDTKSKDENGLTRIEREFLRAKEQGIKIHLLIETEDAMSKILSSKHFRYDKASKVSPASFNAILRSLQAKYNISIEYCRKEDSARLIHDILFYHAREYLKNL